MDTTTLIQEVDNITLAHMGMEIDIDELLLEDYMGAERHLAVALVQGYYKRYLVTLGKDANTSLKQRALVNSKWQATTRLTQELPGLVERATVFVLDEAERTGWYRDLEFDSLQELLASIYDDTEERSSAHYDFRFIVETLLPAAKSFGIDTAYLMGASVQTKKLRGTVPHARNLLEQNKTGKLSDQDVTKALNWMFGIVSDPKVSYTEMKEQFNVFEGKVISRDDPLTGYKMIVTGGQMWYVVVVDEDRKGSMLEQALRNRVDFELTGMDFLLHSVTAMFKKEDINVKNTADSPGG